MSFIFYDNVDVVSSLFQVSNNIPYKAKSTSMENETVASHQTHMQLTLWAFCLNRLLARELTLREISDELYTFPLLDEWKDDCSRQALLSILPQCLHGLETITSLQQKEVALELSICELDNAKIEYPLDCDPQIRQANIDKCIQSLEKSPQFWTSYSGNYRSVKEVCHQVSLPFKKEQIIEVYENVTILFQNVMNDLKTSQADNDEAQKHMKERFEAMFNIVDDIMKESRGSAELMNQTFNVFYENFEVSLNNALVIIEQSYQGANTNMNELEQHVNYFTKEMYHICELIRENQDMLSSSQKDLEAHKEILSNQQNEALKNIKGINEYTLELRDSTKRHFDYIDHKMQFSVFKIHSINELLNRNFDNLQVQRQYINQQSVAMVDDISKAFVSYLNASGQEILASFESSLNTSLENLEEKIEEAVVSMEMLDFKVKNFLNLAHNATNYIANIIPDLVRGAFDYTHKSYVSMMAVFSKAYKLSLCLAVAILFLMTKRFARFVSALFIKWFIIIVVPLVLGVVAAIMTLKLVLVFSSLNS